MARSLFLAAGLSLTLLAAPALSADAPRNTKPYPEPLRQSFVTGCVESGAPRPACECFLRLLEREWTEAEMMAFDQKVAADPKMEPPPYLVKAVQACIADPNAQAVG